MSAQRNEHDLVHRAIEGDAEAFGDLYEQLLDDIYRYIYYRVSDHQEAEDLTEQVFLKAWQNIAGYKVQSVPFKAWIYRIAHNTVVDYYRTSKELAALSNDTIASKAASDPEAQILSQEQSEQLEHALRRLSPNQQSVLILRFISGFATDEIAEVLDRNVGAVRVLQYRALKAMQALLTTTENRNV